MSKSSIKRERKLKRVDNAKIIDNKVAELRKSFYDFLYAESSKEEFTDAIVSDKLNALDREYKKFVKETTAKWGLSTEALFKVSNLFLDSISAGIHKSISNYNQKMNSHAGEETTGE